MKIVIALLMAVLASVSGFAQEERPVNPVRILTAGQHITPYKIEVTFGKTVHILFPTEVRYVDLGVTISSQVKLTGSRMWCVSKRR